MSLLGAWWRRVCQPLDGFLWHRDISHPIIRPVIRNQIMGAGFFLLLGAALYAILPWLFWFGAGMACVTWIFWSQARFFSRLPSFQYNAVFMRGVILRFGLRLGIIAIALFFAMTVFHAVVGAIIGGLIAGSVLALASYAINAVGR